jgi:hypothetical protein
MEKRLIEVSVPNADGVHVLRTLDDTEANRASGVMHRAWIAIGNGPAYDPWNEYDEVSVVHFFPLTGPAVFPVLDEYAPMLVWFAQRQGDYLVLMQAMAADGDPTNTQYDVLYAGTVQDAAKRFADKLARRRMR